MLILNDSEYKKYIKIKKSFFDSMREDVDLKKISIWEVSEVKTFLSIYFFHIFEEISFECLINKRFDFDVKPTSKIIKNPSENNFHEYMQSYFTYFKTDKEFYDFSFYVLFKKKKDSNYRPHIKIITLDSKWLDFNPFNQNLKSEFFAGHELNK